MSIEPPMAYGSVQRTAVLLVNLGTPAAPTAAAVRPYLRQFLSDPRVVELPRWLWWPILNGIVLAVRPRKSAAKYASIWTERGSPLKVHSEQQALLLRGYLGDRGLDVTVALAMRYGEPSIARALAGLQDPPLERLLVLPLYPQYSAAATATVFDAVGAALVRQRNVPELRFVKHFYDDGGYIEALKLAVLAYWKKNGRAQDVGGKLVMSFHGLPRRCVERGDPYRDECCQTAELLARALGLAQDEYRVSFQSRFGAAEWLQPYTSASLSALGAQRARRVDVVCPGFVADCLETLEEIAQEGRAEFVHAGGGEFHYIPCLNDSHPFITALADLVQMHCMGWPVRCAA